MERLSTGLRINSAKDDAAGMAIGTRMSSAIVSNIQASRNANDGISMLQTAEGALGEVQIILGRLQELAVTASSATYGTSDRNLLNTEFTTLRNEVQRILSDTTWNRSALFSAKTINIQGASGAADSISLDFENIIELPYQLYVQRSSIFPLYEFYTNLINFNLIEVIFGNGLYTSGIINNFYKGGYYGISNPNSQIVRMIYEVGILGSIVFLLSMTWPIKYFTKKFEKDKIKLYLTIMLVVISVSLAIRSPAVYIFLGILTSYMHYKKNRLEISKF